MGDNVVPKGLSMVCKGSLVRVDLSQIAADEAARQR
jgi:hypothetical protein